MTCIIIEDQPPAQRILKKYIEDVGSFHLKATFSDALKAMTFLQENSVDLLFLDIHLPKMSGIDFLKTFPNPPAVILTTAFSEYALESYELNVVDYLLKPFSFKRFVQAVAKVPVKGMGSHGTEKEAKLAKDLFIKSGYEILKINTDDIDYIHSDGDYTEIYTNKKRHLSAESLRYWLETLEPFQFVRIHKSYIINSKKIERIVGSQVYLNNKTELPIGRVYKEAFFKKFL